MTGVATVIKKVGFYIRDKIYGSAVFVFTIQKTGSTSLAQALKSHGVKRSYRFHSFFLEHLNITDRDSKRVEHQKKLYNRFIKTNREINIISIVRDPIEQSISHFFDSFRTELKIRNLKELIAVYKHHYSEKYFLSLLSWFDDNFLRTLGIDIFQYPYSQEKGFGLFHQDKKHILIFDSEIPDNEKEKLIRDLLGLKKFKLGRVFTKRDMTKSIGISREKIDSLWEDFVKTVSFSPSLLEKIYHSKFCRHFYSPEKLKMFKERWKREE